MKKSDESVINQGYNNVQEKKKRGGVGIWSMRLEERDLHKHKKSIANFVSCKKRSIIDREG